jgi:hypothetical protein
MAVVDIWKKFQEVEKAVCVGKTDEKTKSMASSGYITSLYPSLPRSGAWPTLPATHWPRVACRRGAADARPSFHADGCRPGYHDLSKLLSEHHMAMLSQIQGHHPGITDHLGLYRRCACLSIRRPGWTVDRHGRAGLRPTPSPRATFAASTICPHAPERCSRIRTILPRCAK